MRLLSENGFEVFHIFRFCSKRNKLCGIYDGKKNNILEKW